MRGAVMRERSLYEDALRIPEKRHATNANVLLGLTPPGLGVRLFPPCRRTLLFGGGCLEDGMLANPNSISESSPPIRRSAVPLRVVGGMQTPRRPPPVVPPEPPSPASFSDPSLEASVGDDSAASIAAPTVGDSEVAAPRAEPGSRRAPRTRSTRSKERTPASKTSSAKTSSSPTQTMFEDAALGVAAAVAPSSRARWWSNLILGVSLRVVETGVQALAPVLTVIRNAAIIAQVAWRLLAPGLLAWAVYAWAPGWSVSYPWGTPSGWAATLGLYAACALVIKVVAAAGRRCSAAVRQGLNSLAEHGARHRDPVSSGASAGAHAE